MKIIIYLLCSFFIFFICIPFHNIGLHFLAHDDATITMPNTSSTITTALSKSISVTTIAANNNITTVPVLVTPEIDTVMKKISIDKAQNLRNSAQLKADNQIVLGTATAAATTTTTTQNTTIRPHVDKYNKRNNNDTEEKSMRCQHPYMCLYPNLIDDYPEKTEFENLHSTTDNNNNSEESTKIVVAPSLSLSNSDDENLRKNCNTTIIGASSSSTSNSNKVVNSDRVSDDQHKKDDDDDSFKYATSEPGYRYSNITMKARGLKSQRLKLLKQLSTDVAKLRQIPNLKWDIGVHSVM